ncbi:sensor histidine kinase [Goodfellowiella coeruleoviolacea]|uniref:sensor histidine kinase n=1 Tax=Goodfellowiella coeruleoviolacea TaxID=334858 RepID=UPI0020A50A8E|nr:sensor histidine kinase [Goodfellowiella coeruleoviolacea]
MESELHPVFTRPLSRGQLVALDWVAGLVAAVVLAAAMTAAPGPDVPLWTVWLVAAGAGLPVGLRRRYPLAVCAVVAVLAVVSLLLRPTWQAFAPVAVAVYPVALTASGRRWLPTSLVGWAAVLAGLAATSAGAPRTSLDVGLLLVGLTLVAGSWTVGRAVRERRAYAARSAGQLAERAVTEERLRIARELHDVVAHSIGVIAVKAGVASHVIHERPDEAHDALRVIAATSRDALGEMRHLLGALRSDVDGQAAQLRPVPGVAGLPDLVRQAAALGVRAELTVRGVDRLPEGTSLAVYRIVQEALTNVGKHAAPATCAVLVDAVGHEVRVEVTDNGGTRRAPRPDVQRGGHGLIGMRERVLTHGGVFAAGPRPGGGFQVSARLPYQPTEESTA